MFFIAINQILFPNSSLEIFIYSKLYQNSN
jgi:hypothetical protein